MADEAQTPSPGMFNPLRPRIRLEEDELGRKGFVRSVWRALRNHDASEAIVISIQAPWGDGKTTLKDMVVNLEETEGKREKLLFVQFNPWEWAAQNQVATAFFAELAKQIEGCAGKEVDKKAAELLAKTVRSLPQVLALGEAALDVISFAALPVNPAVAALAAAGAKMAKKGKELLVPVAKAHADSTKAKTPSLQSVKEQARAQFNSFRQTTHRNIVVFIDDIDRLSGDEIRQVLQLVKINADFPGLIFVLLFDKAYVERRLRRQFGADAASFLEKIVQVELALPKASEDQLYQCFRRDVLAVLERRPPYRAIFEEDRLKQAFDVWFRHHLVNPRKSGRLLSSWAFRLDVFNTGEAEVNPVDLLILEGLALYEAEVYQALSKAYGELFPEPYRDIMDMMARGRGEPGEKVSARMQALNRIAKKRRLMTSLEVAPALRLLLGVEGSDFADVGDQETSTRIRCRRFSEGRFFRRYFRLSIDSGDVSKATVRGLVRAVGTPTAFRDQLTTLERQGVLLDALDQLLAEDIPAPPDLSHFLAHLLDWWEERILLRGSDKQDAGLRRALIRLYEQLMGMREGKDRGAVLQAMLKQTNSVFALRDLVFHEQRKRHQSEDDKASNTTGLLDKEVERDLCQGVATRLLQHFKRNQPIGRPYENEACRWTLSFGGAWQPDIGKELLRTAGGVATLLRGVLEGFGSLPSVDERRGAAMLLAKMLGAADLYQGVETHREKLIQLGEDVDERLRILDRIRSAIVSRDGQEAPEDPA